MRVVAVAAIVWVALLGAGCSTAVSGPSLKVGDCVNETLTTDNNGDQVRAYDPVDCTTAHDDEVFSVFEYPNSTSFPGYEQIGALQQTQCQKDFQGYVGTSWDKSKYTISYASPDEQSWASGDHAIHCLLSDGSDAKVTGSARGTAK